MILKVGEELGCYHSVSVYQNFIMVDGVEKREQRVGADPDHDEKEIKDVVIDDERELYWRIVFEGKNGEVDGNKAPLHSRMQDV